APLRRTIRASVGRRKLGTCNISCFGWKCPVRPIRHIAQRWKPKKIRQRYLFRLARSAQFEYYCKFLASACQRVFLALFPQDAAQAVVPAVSRLVSTLSRLVST